VRVDEVLPPSHAARSTTPAEIPRKRRRVQRTDVDASGTDINGTDIGAGVDGDDPCIRTHPPVEATVRVRMGYEAVIFDLGGVVFPSPLAAFDVYDAEAGLEPGTVRRVVRESAESGAWAALERGELSLDAFFGALATEARASGVEIDVTRVFDLIGASSTPYPSMVRAVGRIREEGLRVGALTNNWISPNGTHAPGGPDRGVTFDVVVESAVEGIRKPEPAIYALALDRLGVGAEATVYLDDLGPNLKPARAMGMTTIKVADPDAALSELSSVLGLDLG